MIIYYITPIDNEVSAAESKRILDFIDSKSEHQVFSTYLNQKDTRGNYFDFWSRQIGQMKKADDIYFYFSTTSVWVPLLLGSALTLGKSIHASHEIEDFYRGLYSRFCKEIDGSWKIKPCPFCGSPAQVVYHEVYDSFVVECIGEKNHGLDYHAATRQESIEIWNERKIV